jgi:hypothetical protein
VEQKNADKQKHVSIVFDKTLSIRRKSIPFYERRTEWSVELLRVKFGLTSPLPHRP